MGRRSSPRLYSIVLWLRATLLRVRSASPVQAVSPKLRRSCASCKVSGMGSTSYLTSMRTTDVLTRMPIPYWVQSTLLIPLLVVTILLSSHVPLELWPTTRLLRMHSGQSTVSIQVYPKAKPLLSGDTLKTFIWEEILGKSLLCLRFFQSSSSPKRKVAIP